MNISKRILMLSGDFTEDCQVITPFYALQMVGHTVDVVCPGKSAGDSIKTSIHDMEGDQTYIERVGHLFPLNATFSEIDWTSYDALIITGGRSPEYLLLNPEVIALTQHFAKENRPIGTICHAIQILAAADLLRGRRCTCFPGVAHEVRLAGGEFVEASPTEAVVDGNLVSAPSWTAQAQWLAKLLKVLGTSVEGGSQ